ncbi:MAG: DUF1330 domain-containing protein [Burkholderiaceae bacterium]|nr:DUF1330 domain-containing protein [Burkholderiaceae bacterium]
MMPAYVIADVKVSDAARYEGYRALSPAAVAAAGGEFVVRGGQSAVLEGDWQPGRLVIVRFPDFAAARSFYDSTLYSQARAARAGATEKFNMVVVEGI